MRPIRLFVSSSPDLAPEREVLGQAVAELLISVGWEIKHTPRGKEDAWEALAFIEDCDLVVCVLGGDFAAPMGLEWEHVQRSKRPLLAYRSRGLHSPSARQLLQRSTIHWTEFRTAQELKQRVKHALAELILDRGERFGLSLQDVEGLLAETKRTYDQQPEEGEDRQGAGRGGIILSRRP